jgi:hypothetical protein
MKQRYVLHVKEPESHANNGGLVCECGDASEETKETKETADLSPPYGIWVRHRLDLTRIRPKLWAFPEKYPNSGLIQIEFGCWKEPDKSGIMEELCRIVRHLGSGIADLTLVSYLLFAYQDRFHYEFHR